MVFVTTIWANLYEYSLIITVFNRRTSTHLWLPCSFDRQGNAKPVTGTPQRNYSVPHISPDETQLALRVYDQKKAQLWKYDFNRKVLNQSTFEPVIINSPFWIPPDGRRISFSSIRDIKAFYHQICWVSIDGNDKLESILPASEDYSQLPFSWSPDGKYLAYVEYRSKTPGIWILPMGDDGKPGKPDLLVENGWNPMHAMSDSPFYQDTCMRFKWYYSGPMNT